MDLKLKQRLTGAIILTSLAIIILPLLLDGNQQERERIMSDIPDAPHIELNDISVADVQQQMEQMERASEARLPREVADETDYEEAPDFTLDQNNLPVNWSIQLGSFSKEENATRLREQLRAENYRTYILHGRTSQGPVYRVLVGPSSSKETLNEMAAQIKKELNLEGQIVRYKIEDDKELLGG